MSISSSETNVETQQSEASNPEVQPQSVPGSMPESSATTEADASSAQATAEPGAVSAGAPESLGEAVPDAQAAISGDSSPAADEPAASTDPSAVAPHGETPAGSEPEDAGSPVEAPAAPSSPTEEHVPADAPATEADGTAQTAAPAAGEKKRRKPVPIPRQVAGSIPDAAASAERWGRVDDDGTVYVRTAEGEKLVGSYPDATPHEALLFFARKYDDLAAQVRLLAQRVLTTDLAAKDAVATLGRLRSDIDEAKVVGDLAALAAAVEDISVLIEKRRIDSDAARAKVRAAARETKERIVTEAESLADSSAWKASGERLRTLVEEWKAAPRLDRRGDDELWKRFSAARSAFDKRRRTHFAALDDQRSESRTRKEKLAKEAEGLAESKEWGPTAQKFRDLMTQWKSSGRAGRAEEEALWQRFRAAQDAFFAARNAVFAERDAEHSGNLAKKEALAKEAEALLPVKDLRAAKSALRSLQERWEAAGHVPRADRDRIDNRMRKVEQAVRDAEQTQWQKSNPESQARAASATAQLRASIDKLEAQAAKARADGNEKAAAEADAAAAAKREWLAATEKYVS